MRMRRLVRCGLLVGATTAAAAPPGFDSLYPAGGRVGTTVEVRVQGKGHDKAPLPGWCSDPAVRVEPGKKPGHYQITLPADAAPGPRVLRFFTDEGSSPPRLFAVNDLAEQLEQEPNDNVASAHTHPAVSEGVCNGVLEKAGDVDTHALEAKKGERLVLELQGYGLGSPMDPALRLLDAHGVELALAHDAHNLDPYLEHLPTADGRLFAQVFAFAHPPAADVAFKGSANHVYRLVVRRAGPPSPAPAAPGTLTLPAIGVPGRLSTPGQVDRHRFTAAKGDTLRLRVRALAPRSPLDATLAVADAEGKVLQQADDSDGLNPVLRWKAPSEGSYQAVVSDRHHQGGARFDYELSVAPAGAEVTATLDNHAYRLEAGGSVKVKLTVKIDGTPEGKIEAQARALPAGVTAQAVEVPAKGGEVQLTLKASAEAAASQSPFRIELMPIDDKAGGQPIVAEWVLPFTEPRGEFLQTRHDQPWLTVSAKGEKKK